jgi:Protein of unknown function (DUF2934)
MAPTMAREIDEESSVAPKNEEIARLAYSLWEARGGVGGSPEEDWLAAEAELRLR